METAAASAAVRSWAAHNKREVDRAGQRQLESVAEQLEWTEGAAGKFEWELFPALVAAVGDDVKVLCAGELSIPGVRCASVRLRAECRCHQDDGETEIRFGVRCAIVPATADPSEPAPASEFARPMLEFAGSRGGSEEQTGAAIDMEALEALRASALSSVEIVDVLSLLLALPWLVRDAPFYSDIRDMLREELLYELCELEGDSSDDELEPKPEPGVPEAEPEPPTKKAKP